jgi:hypothetical protein
LTGQHENGHVDVTELHRGDKQIGSSEAGDECRRRYPQKSQ